LTLLDVALVTCARLPDGDVDDRLLYDALGRAGVKTEFVCWDDPDARWPVVGVAVVRSTWDYHERLAGFLGWAEYVSSVTRLRNRFSTLRWNSHKAYLLDLEAAGVPVVPTRLVRAGTSAVLGPGEHIVKPAVSVGAERTTRFATQADLDALAATDDVLVQPYLREIESDGEVSIVCVDGEPTHAVRKIPAAGDFRSQEHHGADVVLVEVDERQRAFCHTALAGFGEVPLYARVDAIDIEGGLHLMELELIEPTLWLRWHPPAADVLAAAIVAQLTQSR
jgi:glutathione synthase/RimK-type ligase-like ATP-grasp enzyme